MFKACLVQRIEIITGKQKRCSYTAEEKSRFVALSMRPGYSVSLVARPEEYPSCKHNQGLYDKTP